MIKGLTSMKNIFSVLACVVLLTMGACNKSEHNGLESPDNAANPKAKERKVLMVLVDGGYGSEVKKIAPTNMNDLADNSIFSWDALSTTENTATVTNEAGWATLLTGVNPSKHGVLTGTAGNHFNQYPTIFSHLKTLSPELRSVAIATSSSFANDIAADATEKKTVATDAAAKDAAVTELSSGNPDLLVVQFSGAEQAGQTDGFSAAAATYRAAILAIDGYIGDIMTALNKRVNVPNEDWMVVVASTKGNNTGYDPGIKPWSAFDDNRHNSFVIIANPRFAYNNKSKPPIFPYYGATNSYRIGNLDLANRRYAQVKDSTIYSFGSSGDFSAQCKVKIPAGDYGYPAFLGKRLAFERTEGNHGWLFFLEDADWQANFNGANGSGDNTQARGTKVSDNQWHTLTLVVAQGSGTTRNATVYTDGVKNATTNISTRDLTTKSPFTVGWIGGGGNDIQMSITDVRIYDRALTDEEISNNYCRTDADLSDPSLLGFWPSTTVEYENGDQKKPFFRDYIAGNHLYIVNPSIISFSDATSNACPLVDDVAYKTVPRNVDVATQIYLWMGYSIPQNWGLEGQSWVPKYVDIVE
ncbi:MAG: DUF4983 domain-containing protein [Niabella sp.]